MQVSIKTKNKIEEILKQNNIKNKISVFSKFKHNFSSVIDQEEDNLDEEQKNHNKPDLPFVPEEDNYKNNKNDFYRNFSMMSKRECDEKNNDNEREMTFVEDDKSIRSIKEMKNMNSTLSSYNKMNENQKTKNKFDKMINHLKEIIQLKKNIIKNEDRLYMNIKKITILAKKEWSWKHLEKTLYDNILDLEFKAKKSAVQIEEDFYLKFSIFINDNSLKDIEKIKIQITDDKKS